MSTLDQALLAAAARADFLDGRELCDPEVPEALLASWRRSQSAGVDPSGPRSVHDSDTDCDSLLVRCAAPVLKQLEGEIGDLPLSIILIDERARVVQRFGGSPQVERLLDSVDLAPGFDYAESVMGTNGIGTVFPAGQPVSVVGPQHYSECLHQFGCVGAPILDPTTGRVAGVVDITSVADAWNPLYKTLVKNAAKDIGRNMLSDHSQAQRAVLDAYLVTVAQSAGKAVLAFGDMLFLANAAAQRLFNAEEQRALREHTATFGATGEHAVDTVALPGGRRLVAVDVTRVTAGSKAAGRVVVVEPLADQASFPPVESQMTAPKGISGGHGALALHATGHLWAPDHTLLRVDVINGKWTATHFRPDMTIRREFVGSDEAVHERARRWAVGAE